MLSPAAIVGTIGATCIWHCSANRGTLWSFSLPCRSNYSLAFAERHKRIGAPSRETIESLRLMKAFVKLSARQRFEVVELVERLSIDPAAASDHPLS
jgi:hypothetical protein